MHTRLNSTVGNECKNWELQNTRKTWILQWSQSFLQITSVKSDDTQCLTHYAATGLDTLPLTLFLGYVFLKATHGCHLILLLLHWSLVRQFLAQRYEHFTNLGPRGMGNVDVSASPWLHLAGRGGEGEMWEGEKWVKGREVKCNVSHTQRPSTAPARTSPTSDNFRNTPRWFWDTSK